jgi:hypothetical protein
LITAATGFVFLTRWFVAKLPHKGSVAIVLSVGLFISIISHSVLNSLWSGPHDRMFTNRFGGGTTAAGSYFPHDEYYDAATREVINTLANIATQNTIIACETPGLFEYYAQKAGHSDLKFVSLTDKQNVAELKQDDFVVLVIGRRYYSNDAYQQMLTSVTPTAEIRVANITAATIYKLDEVVLGKLKEIASRN